MTDSATTPATAPLAEPEVKRSQRKSVRAWFAALGGLPLLVGLFVVGWVVLGALPDADLSPDLINQLAALPRLCVQAGCAVVMAIFAVRVCMFEPPTALERAWWEAAALGDKNARWLVAFVTLRWAVAIGGFLAFFWPVR